MAGLLSPSRRLSSCPNPSAFSKRPLICGRSLHRNSSYSPLALFLAITNEAASLRWQRVFFVRWEQLSFTADGLGDAQRSLGFLILLLWSSRSNITLHDTPQGSSAGYKPQKSVGQTATHPLSRSFSSAAELWAIVMLRNTLGASAVTKRVSSSVSELVILSNRGMSASRQRSGQICFVLEMKC